MTYIITFLDNNGKLAVYTGINIYGLYSYLEIIEAPTTLTTSVQRSHNFFPSSSTKIYTETLQKVIVSLRIRHNIIWKCCGIIGHEADACIICGHNFLPPSLIINMNQFNALRVDEPTGPLIECNIQPPVSHFKSITYRPKTIPVVSSIMVILNHHSTDNGDV